MKKITFRCETITPMFLSGADGETPEIRPASIKGALRFWWRALHGDLSIEKLHTKEAEIFGGSGEGQGRSKVIIRVKNNNILIERKGCEIKSKHVITTDYFKKKKNSTTKKLERTNQKIEINIFDYLAFGVVQYDKGSRKNLIIKDYINVDSTFDIIIKFDVKYEKDILDSVSMFFKYGNLGSKARNGFGGITLLNDDIFKLNSRTFNFSKIQLPKYSAFFLDSTLFETKKSYDTWDKALAEIGIVYRDIRLSLEENHNFIKRQHVALPLIAQGERNITSQMKNNRRSKSYLLKIQKVDSKYKGIILSLPSQLEDGGYDSYNVYKIMNSEMQKNLDFTEIKI